jgi:hypothetical protein
MKATVFIHKEGVSMWSVEAGKKHTDPNDQYQTPALFNP